MSTPTENATPFVEAAKECPSCDDGLTRGWPGGQPCAECCNPRRDVNTLARWLAAHSGTKWWKMGEGGQEFLREEVRHVAKVLGVDVPEFSPEPCTRCRSISDWLSAGKKHVCPDCGRRYESVLQGDVQPAVPDEQP